MQAKGIDRSINGSFSPLRDCRPFFKFKSIFLTTRAQRGEVTYTKS